MSPAPAGLRIVIADSQPAFRQGLRLLLGDDPRIAVVGDTGTATDAAWLITARHATLLLINVSLRGALGVLADIQSWPGKVIALGEEAGSEPLVEALRLVDDVVLKDSELPLLFSTIRAVADNERSIRHPSVAPNAEPVSLEEDPPPTDRDMSIN